MKVPWLLACLLRQLAMTMLPRSLGSVSHHISERAKTIMAGNAIDKQRVLDLRALTDIVNNERTGAVLAPGVADNDDVRKSPRQLLRHQIAGRIVNWGA